MTKFSTVKELLAAGDVSKGDVRKVAAALWRQNAVATRAFPAPYKLVLPDFDRLPDHVQGFILKGLLDAEIEATFTEKGEGPDDSPHREDNEES